MIRIDLSRRKGYLSISVSRHTESQLGGEYVMGAR
jgi:hypothetical protein